MSRHRSSSSNGTLIDRGANGGIAGSDVRVISTSDRRVDVQGVSNHQVTAIPIVTCGGVVNTHRGDAIVIMNQYARVRNGKTIHSCIQLESHKNDVHDKSKSVGGKQRIITPDGYAIPLHIQDGLVYMDMQPYTDRQFDTLPHIILTSGITWDPTIFDNEVNDDQWFDAVSDIQHIPEESLFDEYGEYRYTHELEATCAEINKNESLSVNFINSIYEYISINNRKIQNRPVDCDKYRAQFGWLPDDVITKTFENTTQFYPTAPPNHLRKRYKSPYPACNIPRREEPLATDTVYSDTPAVEDGSKIAQIFVGTKSLVSDVFGMKTEKQFINTLQDIIRSRGAPTKLVSDNAQLEISNKVKDILRHLFIDDWQSEPYYQHQNPAERRYQDIKRITNRILDRTGAPPELWLLGLQYVCYLLNHLSCLSLAHKVPLAILYGTTPDISALLPFSFYEKVYYKTNETAFLSDSPESVGHFVGIATNVGNALTYKILSENGHIISRSAVCSATDATHANQRAESSSEVHEPVIRSTLDDQPDEPSSIVIIDPTDLVGTHFDLPNADGVTERAEIVEAIRDQQETHENSSSLTKFRVSRNRDQYEQILSYDEVMDHLEKQGEEPIQWEIKRIVGHQGPLSKSHKDFIGSTYNVTVEWANGERTTEPLSIIAADSPVTCAVYARDNNLLGTTGWKRFKNLAKTYDKLLRHANKAKIRNFGKRKFKYGYIVPYDYKQAMALDSKNGNTKWDDTTKLEMQHILGYKVFKDMGKGYVMPSEYKEIRVRLVYDVKHDGRHRARLVAGGHLTDEPDDSTYSGVVSLRGFRLLVFLAELNGLETWATDIASAYLEAYTSEKVYIVAGPEFGDLKDHVLVIDRALYGLRTSGQRWHDRLAECLKAEGFVPSKTEPDLWMQANDDVYEYIGVYVDDLAFAMKDPQAFVDALTNKYNFKVKGTGPIEFHLGADFNCESDETLVMSPTKYIGRMIQTYERFYNSKPSTRAQSPLEPNNHPELDKSELLDDDGIQQYQSLIGCLQWAISLGRFDISSAVASMSSFRAAPRRGHLNRVKRICGYLYKMKDAKLRFRTHTPDFSDVPINKPDWSSIYGDVKEQLPDDAPPPLGKTVTLTHYVDANLYHDALTGRSLTACLHFINATLLDWYSKKQSTVETATYSSEIVAAQTCIEQIIDIRNTLRYLGVPIHETSYLFGDNESFVNSATNLYAKLHKRHTALALHRVREAIASGFIAFTFIP